MKFKGLVITDAMDMKGVVDFNKDQSADVSALLAGNDILLMPDDLDESTKSIKLAIETGVITEKRLKYSVKKILMAKYKAGLNNIKPVKLNNIVSEMNTNEDKSLFEEIVEKSISKFGAPVYVRHEIVHNKQVVEELKEKGAIFVDELSDVDDVSRPVIFSAHGVPKSVPEEAKLKNLSFVDATCPLVSKVHRESEQLNKNGFDILLIGHKNHPEVIGTMGQLPKGSIKLIETINDVELLKENDFKKPLAYITQTTLSVDDTAEIIKALKSKFPKIKGPIKEDICYATTNRQSAVKEIASKCDMFFVVGSRNSSNSVRLVEVAKKAGCNNSHLMHSEKEIPFNEIENSETIGISSGASAPEKLVQTLLDSLRKDRNVSIEEVVVAEEKVVFKLPKELN